MANIKITKTKGAEESVELLAKSIVQVAEGFKRVQASQLGERALIVLLQDGIGASNITKGQIQLVLEALPRLKAWYVKPYKK